MLSIIDPFAMPGYSADVRLWFIADGVSFPLAQVGPNGIVFREPTELDPCDGEVVMEVDGEQDRWPVRLAEPVVPFERAIRVRFVT